MNKIDSFFRKVDTAGKASGNAQPLGLKNSSAAHPAEPAKKAPPATKGAVPPAEGQENDAAATVGSKRRRSGLGAAEQARLKALLAESDGNQPSPEALRQLATELGLEEREVRDWMQQNSQKWVAQQRSQAHAVVDLTETTPSKPAAPSKGTLKPMDQDQLPCAAAEAQGATADELLQQGSSGVPASATGAKAHTPAMAASSFGGSKAGTSSTSHQTGPQQPGSTAGLAPAGSGVDMNPAVTSSSPAAALQNRPALLADMQSQAEEAAEALKEEHLLPSSIAAALDAQQSGSKDGDDEHMADAQPRDSQAGASGSQLVASRIRSEELAAFIEGRRCTLSELVSLLSTATGGNASADQRETWRTQIIDLAARKPYGAKDVSMDGLAAAEDSCDESLWFWELREPKKSLVPAKEAKEASAGANKAAATNNRKMCDLFRKRRKELHDRLTACSALAELLTKAASLAATTAEGGKEGAGKGGKAGGATAAKGLENKIAKAWQKVEKVPEVAAIEAAMETGLSALGEKDAGRLAHMAARAKEREEKAVARASAKEAKEAERAAKQAEKEAEKASKAAEKEAEKAAKAEKKELKSTGYKSNKELEKSKSLMASFFRTTAKTPNKPPSATGEGLIAAGTPAGAGAAAGATPAGAAAARPAAVPTPGTGGQMPARHGGAPGAANGANPAPAAAPAYATPHVYSGNGRIRHMYGGHLAFVASRAAAEGLTVEQWVEQQRVALDAVWEARPGESEPLDPYMDSLKQRWRAAAVKERQTIKGAPPTWARRPGFTSTFSLHSACVAMYGEGYDPQAVRLWRRKLTAHHTSVRPPYYGSWSKTSSGVSGRRPFGRDITLDYEEESDQEWEEEPEGESLSDDECEASSIHGGEGSDEEGDEAGGKFVVDDGYLSGDEGVRMEDDGDGDVEMGDAKGATGGRSTGTALEALEAGVSRALRSNRALVLVATHLLPNCRNGEPPLGQVQDPLLLKCLAGCSLRIESIITPPAEWDIYTAPPPSAPAQAHAPGAAAGAPDGGAGTAFGSGTPYLPAGAVPAGTVVVPGTEAVHVHAAGGVGASGGAGKGSGAASGAQGRGRPSTPFPPHLLPVLQSHLARTKERAIDKVVESFLAEHQASSTTGALPPDSVTAPGAGEAGGGATAAPGRTSGGGSGAAGRGIPKSTVRDMIKQIAEYKGARGWVLRPPGTSAGQGPTPMGLLGGARPASSTPGAPPSAGAAVAATQGAITAAVARASPAPPDTGAAAAPLLPGATPAGFPQNTPFQAHSLTPVPYKQTPASAATTGPPNTGVLQVLRQQAAAVVGGQQPGGSHRPGTVAPQCTPAGVQAPGAAAASNGLVDDAGTAAPAAQQAQPGSVAGTAGGGAALGYPASTGAAAGPSAAVAASGATGYAQRAPATDAGTPAPTPGDSLVPKHIHFSVDAKRASIGQGGLTGGPGGATPATGAKPPQHRQLPVPVQLLQGTPGTAATSSRLGAPVGISRFASLQTPLTGMLPGAPANTPASGILGLAASGPGAPSAAKPPIAEAVAAALQRQQHGQQPGLSTAGSEAGSVVMEGQLGTVAEGNEQQHGGDKRMQSTGAATQQQQQGGQVDSMQVDEQSGAAGVEEAGGGAPAHASSENLGNGLQTSCSIDAPDKAAALPAVRVSSSSDPTEPPALPPAETLCTSHGTAHPYWQHLCMWISRTHDPTPEICTSAFSLFHDQVTLRRALPHMPHDLLTAMAKLLRTPSAPPALQAEAALCLGNAVVVLGEAAIGAAASGSSEPSAEEKAGQRCQASMDCDPRAAGELPQQQQQQGSLGAHASAGESHTGSHLSEPLRSLPLAADLESLLREPGLLEGILHTIQAGAPTTAPPSSSPAAAGGTGGTPAASASAADVEVQAGCRSKAADMAARLLACMLNLGQAPQATPSTTSNSGAATATTLPPTLAAAASQLRVQVAQQSSSRSLLRTCCQATGRRQLAGYSLDVLRALLLDPVSAAKMCPIARVASTWPSLLMSCAAPGSVTKVGEQKRALLALHALVTSQAAAPLLGLAAPQPQQGSGQAAGKVTRASATQQRSAAALAQKLLDLLVQVLETAADAGSGAEGQQKAGRSQARYQELTQVSLQLAVALVPTWELQLAAEGVDKEHLLRSVSQLRRAAGAVSQRAEEPCKGVAEEVERLLEPWNQE